MAVSLSSVENNKPSAWQKAKAAIVGSTVAGIGAQAIMIPTGLGLINGLTKINRSVTRDEIMTLNKAGSTILRTTGLANKGVEILRSVKLKQFKLLTKLLPKELAKILTGLNPYVQVAMGRNAAFDFTTNKVLCGNKMPLSQFHELGHAMNFHKLGGFSGKLGKFFQDLRLDVVMGRLKESIGKSVSKKFPVAGFALALASSFIGITALFKNKKAEGEKPVGFWDKTTTFIKNNAGKLSFMTMLPIVIEEGLASLKGQKLAKTLLSPQLFKKVKISNALGFTSYLAAATIVGLSTMFAVKIRDKIAQPNIK